MGAMFPYVFSHPGVDRIWFFEGEFYFLKNTVIFDPIDRIWIFGVSTFCPLRDGFICHILSMGLENDLFHF